MVSEHRDAPIGEAIPGLEKIAALPIPWSHLPRRAHTMFSTDITRWSDLAQYSLAQLLDRPKVGAATVRAIVTAARDAAARHQSHPSFDPDDAANAAQHLLDCLDDRDRVVLAARIWANPKVSQPAVAEQLGVSKIWVQRREDRAMSRFRELINDPAHHDLPRHTGRLRHQLGPFLHDSTLRAQLRRIDIDPSSQIGQMLLHLAGPYVRQGEWWQNTASDGQRRVDDAIDQVLNESPAPKTSVLTRTVRPMGVRAGDLKAYLAQRPDLKRFGRVWVRWGGSAADKTATVLSLRGAPMAPAEIATLIAERYLPGSIREGLTADDRFVRTSRLTWGLREWGPDQYDGIAAEARAQISAADGQMRVADLVATVQAQFPDVAARSVLTILSTRAFVRQDGLVRLRSDADPFRPAPALNTARGAFRISPDEIRLALPVTPKLLQGSALYTRPAVAAALAVEPGTNRAFANRTGDVTVTWRLTAASPVTISTLRRHAAALSARLGDTVVLIFDIRQDRVGVDVIGHELTGAARLSTLLGRPVTAIDDALASALDCPPHRVAEVLTARGDAALVGLPPDP